jgi:hypothetical protein
MRGDIRLVTIRSWFAATLLAVTAVAGRCLAERFHPGVNCVSPTQCAAYPRPSARSRIDRPRSRLDRNVDVRLTFRNVDGNPAVRI